MTQSGISAVEQFESGSLPDNQLTFPEDDPAPTAPIEPEFESCCGSGCGDSCVFDIYYVLRAQYLVDYAAWQARQAAKKEKPL